MLIVTGHQPVFFHPGILARFAAARHEADAQRGDLVFLVVDHHSDSPQNIEVPVLVDGELEVRTVSLGVLDAARAMRDQTRVEVAHPTFATGIPFVDAGIAAIATSLKAATGDTASEQFTSAVQDLVAPWATIDHQCTSTHLLRTSFGRAVVDAMRRDPAACRDAYNAAIEAHPHRGVAPLEGDELPLWHGPCNEAVRETLEDWTDLRPRAILLTLLARAVFADEFVHGTGGSRYDDVMEEWCSRWLQVPLAPSAKATATIRLPLVVHETGHMPQNQRRDYLEAIEAAPRGSLERRAAFAAMKSASGTSHRDAKRQRSIVRRRDWAFPLYEPDQLDAVTTARVVPTPLQASLHRCP
ncbi:MAG: hypothetical protein QGH76_03095 [Phycisphaerales bacterium]|nr:hypothetical protein [Phycisphaerales bacterium]